MDWGDPKSSISKAFYKSPLFGRTINPHHLYSWLTEVVTTVPPVPEMYKNALHAIANGVDIRKENQELFDFALANHAAHPLTQHNNERAVKEGALMQSTCKSGRWANIYAIASNGFTGNEIDDEDVGDDNTNSDGDTVGSPGDDNDASTSSNDATSDDESEYDCCFGYDDDSEKGASRREQGQACGPRKIKSFFGILARFEAQVEREERRLGNDIKSQKAHFRSLLIDQADSEKAKQAETAAIEIMSVADIVKAPNARQRVRGEDKPFATLWLLLVFGTYEKDQP
jgi:hypothetical protein